MKKFLLRLLLFTAIAISALALLSSLVDQGLRQSNYFGQNDWRRLYAGKIQADLIVLGNSHAEVQVNPAVLDSVLQLSSYNLGMSGCQLDLNIARYHTYLRHNKVPRFLIVVLDHFFLNHTSVNYNRGAFLPHLNDPDIGPALYGIGEPGHHRYLPFLKYSRQPGLIGTGLSEWPGRTDISGDTGYNGFRPNLTEPDEFRNEHWGSNRIREEIRPLEFYKFVCLLQEAREQGTRCIVVVPPVRSPVTRLFEHREQYWALMKQTAHNNGALFLNYTDMPLCDSQQYFYTISHLNKKGADLFTEKLAGDLREISIRPATQR